jgi:hypothetical protein
VRSGPRGLFSPGDIDWRFSQTDAPVRSPVVAVGLAVVGTLVVVGLAVLAGAFVVHTVSAALFGGHGLAQGAPAATGGGPQTLLLKQEGGLVNERRSAIGAYAVTVAEFKLTMSRHPDALGLDARDARRRDGVLAGLVLECISAVDQYNLGAATVPATQLRQAGLPEHFVWADECAAGQ